MSARGNGYYSTVTKSDVYIVIYCLMIANISGDYSLY